MPNTWDIYIKTACAPKLIHTMQRGAYEEAEAIYFDLVDAYRFPPSIWVECGDMVYNKPEGLIQ